MGKRLVTRATHVVAYGPISPVVPPESAWHSGRSGEQMAYQQDTPTPSYGYPRTNGMAIASLVLGLAGFVTCGFTSLLAIVFGHVAVGQIQRDGTEGRAMALTGALLGWALTGLWIVFWTLLATGVITGLTHVTITHSAPPSPR
jgi:hypothetical protein